MTGTEGGVASPVDGLMQQNVKFIVTPAPTLSGASPMSSLKTPVDLKTKVQTWSKIIDVAEREIERKGKEMQGLKARLRSVEWEALSRAREVLTLTDKLKEVEFKLAEKETQVKTILSGLDVRENQEKNLDHLIAAAIEDKVSWEKRYKYAVNELELKTQYLDDKENFWSSEMQILENRIQDQQETIGTLKEQLLGLQKMQESGNLAAFGRQSAALKERSSLIHEQSDLAKKLGDMTRKSQSQNQQIEFLETQLEIAKKQNGVYTSTLIPLLEDSGLFLHSVDAKEVSESVKALVDSLMAELRLSGKEQKFKLNPQTAKELLSIKERTMESQQKQTKLLKELEYTTREAKKLTRAIMDEKTEEEEEEEEEEQVAEAESPEEPMLWDTNDDALRRERSATLIQTRYRGFKQRKQYEEMRDVQSEASRVIQKHYRIHQSKESQRKEENAAKVIQSTARSWKVQKEVKVKRSKEASTLQEDVMSKAARTLQSHERARQTRKKYKELKHEREEKAITIQKHFRSKKAKDLLKSKKETAPQVNDFGIFCNDEILTNGSTVRACGRPSNGTTLCMFQWTRQETLGAKDFVDIIGATTPEYVLSPDDVGKVIGVRCTPTNERNESGLPATDTVNEGNPITMTKDLVSEITNISTRGSATFQAQLVKFGKSTASPVTVTVTIDKKQLTLTKKEKVLLKIKYETLPEIRLSPEYPTLCLMTIKHGYVMGSDKGSDVHLNFAERVERDAAVVLVRHFTNLLSKSKPSLLQRMFSSKKTR